MKILFVNKFLYPNGGSETYIFELGKELIAKGHQVQYFGMEHPDNIVGNDVGAYTSNIDFHGESLRSKIAAPFKIIYSLEARHQIRRILDDFEPDVVHLNNINFQITPSVIYEARAWERDRISKLNRGLQIIFTAHDYQWICPNHMMYITEKKRVCDSCILGDYSNCTKNRCIHNSKMRSLLGTVEAYYYKWRNTYSMVDRIICPSQFLFQQFAVNSALNVKLEVMHNFIPSLTETPKELVPQELGKDIPSRYIIYFGRFDEQKGISTLLHVCKRLPEVAFVFAGAGPLETEIDEVENIINVGFQRGEILSNLIRMAEFSVYPSEWYENCPFSVMESQMYMTPVVASNIGGIPELINTDDNPTGVLFEVGDSEGLYEAIKELWNNPSKIERLSHNCQNQRFDTVEEYCNSLYFAKV